MVHSALRLQMSSRRRCACGHDRRAPHPAAYPQPHRQGAIALRAGSRIAPMFLLLIEQRYAPEDEK